MKQQRSNAVCRLVAASPWFGGARSRAIVISMVAVAHGAHPEVFSMH